MHSAVTTGAYVMVQGILKSLRYLYYMRFSLLLWLFPVIMAELNGKLTALTGGILTAENGFQYVCIGFFMVTTGFVGLIGCRVVIINGVERFERRDDLAPANAVNVIPADFTAPPAFLTKLLNNDAASPAWESLAVVVAILPSLIAFIHLAVYGHAQEVDLLQIAGGLVVGTALAWFFWWTVNLLYYVVYPLPDVAPNTPVRLGSTAARTILFPRVLFKLPPPGAAPAGLTAESAGLNDQKAHRLRQKFSQFAEWAAEHHRLTGYIGMVSIPPPAGAPPGDPAPAPIARIYEGPFLSAIAAIGFFAIYLVLWPLTAPVPVLGPAVVTIVLLLVAGGLLIWLFRRVQQQHQGVRGLTLGIVAVSLFPLVFPLLYFITDSERFPAYASILVAVTSLLWILTGLAYLLDRYRVPVATVLLLVIFVPRMLHWDGGGEEHYLSVKRVDNKTSSQPTPAELLDSWYKDPDHDSGKPVVIITATGGGLHASAWTASVLAALERHANSHGDALYQHVLLTSTVSGGSTGMMSYLDQVRSVKPEFNQAPISAACSSLEAVSWGLVYRDFPGALLFPLPLVLRSSDGLDDLDATPLQKDRTWALRQGFARNLKDVYCNKVWDGDKRHPIFFRRVLEDSKSAIAASDSLTLLTQAPPGNDPVTGKKRHMPAIAMNSTTSEYGERYLMASYELPRYTIGENEALPAESFLQVYGDTNLSDGNTPRYADLPLATAAQLSATFPYVSSAARFPQVAGRSGTHFIDGGYYDNDGTATVIEFLRYALDKPRENIKAVDKKTLAALKDLQERKVRVLLIEIRNDAFDPSQPQEEFRSFPTSGQTAPATGNLFTQITAPLSGFWNAGHESVTPRNRASLQVLRQAYGDRLQIKQIVIEDRHSGETGADPLNWSLTPAQRNEVKRSASDTELAKVYEEVMHWMNNKCDEEWKKTVQSTAPQTQPSNVPSAHAAPQAPAGPATGNP
jgi:hypothetical protein